MYFRRQRLEACERFWLQILLPVAFLASLYIICSPVFAQAQAPRPSRLPPLPVIRLTHDLIGDDAISALGTNLQAVAAHYRKTSGELKVLLREDRSVHVDR